MAPPGSENRSMVPAILLVVVAALILFAVVFLGGGDDDAEVASKAAPPATAKPSASRPGETPRPPAAAPRATTPGAPPVARDPSAAGRTLEEVAVEEVSEVAPRTGEEIDIAVVESVEDDPRRDTTDEPSGWTPDGTIDVGFPEEDAARYQRELEENQPEMPEDLRRAMEDGTLNQAPPGHQALIDNPRKIPPAELERIIQNAQNPQVPPEILDEFRRSLDEWAEQQELERQANP